MKNIMRIIVAIWFLAGFCASAYMYYYAYFVADIKQWPTEAIPFIHNSVWMHILMTIPIVVSAAIQFVAFWLVLILIYGTIGFYGLGSIFAAIGFIFTGKFHISSTFDIFCIWN